MLRFRDTIDIFYNLLTVMINSGEVMIFFGKYIKSKTFCLQYSVSHRNKTRFIISLGTPNPHLHRRHKTHLKPANKSKNDKEQQKNVAEHPRLLHYLMPTSSISLPNRFLSYSLPLILLSHKLPPKALPPPPMAAEEEEAGGGLRRHLRSRRWIPR